MSLLRLMLSGRSHVVCGAGELTVYSSAQQHLFHIASTILSNNWDYSNLA